MSKLYFPGRDFPDREAWLARRSTPRRLKRERVIYQGPQPLNAGINQAKRLVDLASDPAGAHTNLVHSRHKYRRQTSEQK